MLESKRWVVNYTKHVQQKRKVYHDGILELKISSRKVMLYDDTEKLLDARFLNKDEDVEFGGTLAFESHLVDIGELHVDQNPPEDSEVTGSVKMKRDWKSFQQTISKKNHVVGQTMRKIQHVGDNIEIHSEPMQTCFKGQTMRRIQHVGDNIETHSEPIQTCVKEWDALYTTQIMQKAKRYHDGVLRLQACGSHMNQVTLLREDETVLASKYLKSAAFLETGVSFELSNYLVQICDSRNHQQQAQQQELDKSGTSTPAVIPMQPSKIENKGKFLTKKSLHDVFKKDISEEPLAVNNAGGWRGSEAAETLQRKPFRNVFQILSNLRGRNSTNQEEVSAEVQAEHALKIASDAHCEGGSLAESEEVHESNGAQTTSVSTCSKSPSSEPMSVLSTTDTVDHSQREVLNIFQALPSTLSSGSVQESKSGIIFSNKTDMKGETLESKSLSSGTFLNDRMNDYISSETIADTCHLKCRHQSSSEKRNNRPSGIALQSCVDDNVSKECYSREPSSPGEGFDQARLENPPCPNSSSDNTHSSKEASGEVSTKSETKPEDMPTFDLGF